MVLGQEAAPVKMVVTDGKNCVSSEFLGYQDFRRGTDIAFVVGANAIILQPELDLHPTTTLGIYLKALFVWREDTADDLYNMPGNLIRVV
jgi:hypothetical protein